ncbi:MAG TPA: chorismate mutase, partial [Jatrophihabitantaceae bacterium]|nr:chorismate mutase [Jatrophihabitantaceae bacterium]
HTQTADAPGQPPGAFLVPGPRHGHPSKGTPMTMATAAADESALEDDADTIPALRSQIDALDEAITRLVAERARLSRRVQSARMNSGGTRVQLGRERVVLDGYRKVLGPDGAALGDAVLRVCRGAR